MAVPTSHPQQLSRMLHTESGRRWPFWLNAVFWHSSRWLCTSTICLCIPCTCVSLYMAYVLSVHRYVQVCMHMCVHICACGGQRHILGIVPQPFALAGCLTFGDLLAPLAPLLPPLQPVLKVQAHKKAPSFLRILGELKSVPHACAVGTLCPEPPPQPSLHLFLCLKHSTV